MKTMSKAYFLLKVHFNFMVMVIVINATFNNISAITWQSVLLRNNEEEGRKIIIYILDNWSKIPSETIEIWTDLRL
jgi:hypothetical protein